jgi:site-specific DNA-methyltransferase (adenine-specific)
MLELNRIYQGDSTERINELDENSVQLTVSSPPYFAFKDYGDDPGNIENFAEYKQYTAYLKNWMNALYRVTDEDGHVCIIVDDKHTNRKTEGININRGTHARLILFAEEAGFEYKDLIIWAKARAGHASGGSGCMLGSYPYPPNIPFVNWFEYILIFRKAGKARAGRVSSEVKEKSLLTWNNFLWASESIWKIPPERNQAHPCPFPEEIARRLIKLFSFYGDTVLDPFIGSGTVAMASKTLGRKYIGFDINPKFCARSTARLTQELLLLEGSK